MVDSIWSGPTGAFGHGPCMRMRHAYAQHAHTAVAPEAPSHVAGRARVSKRESIRAYLHLPSDRCRSAHRARVVGSARRPSLSACPRIQFGLRRIRSRKEFSCELVESARGVRRSLTVEAICVGGPSTWCRWSAPPTPLFGACITAGPPRPCAPFYGHLSHSHVVVDRSLAPVALLYAVVAASLYSIVCL